MSLKFTEDLRRLQKTRKSPSIEGLLNDFEVAVAMMGDEPISLNRVEVWLQRHKVADNLHPLLVAIFKENGCV